MSDHNIGILVKAWHATEAGETYQDWLMDSEMRPGTCQAQNRGI